MKPFLKVGVVKIKTRCENGFQKLKFLGIAIGRRFSIAVIFFFCKSVSS